MEIEFKDGAVSSTGTMGCLQPNKPIEFKGDRLDIDGLQRLRRMALRAEKV